VSDAAVQSFVEKWLSVQPQQRVALPFIDQAQRDGYLALAALEQELIASAYGIREPQVATSKLNWWAEELSGAAASGGRHPLTKALFAQANARAIPAERWLTPVLAAMGQLDEGTASDFSSQVAAASQMHGALAALETAWWYGVDAPAERATKIATLSHLLYVLTRLEDDAERERLPLPMARLARFGLSRTQLGQDSPERRAALKAQLGDIIAGFRQAACMDEPLSVFRSIEAHTGASLAARAARAAEPLAALQTGQGKISLSTTWHAWKATRAWQRRTH
jgi:phytoene synthase